MLRTAIIIILSSYVILAKAGSPKEIILGDTAFFKKTPDAYFDMIGFSFKKHIPDGDYIVFFDNRKLKKACVGSFYNEKKISHWSVYYEDNRIFKEMNYDSLGRKDGIFQFCSPEDSSIETKIFTKDTLKNGLSWYCYFPNGQLKYFVTIKNGLEEGVSISFYNTSAISLISHYSQGIKVAEEIEYYKNGTKKAEKCYEVNQSQIATTNNCRLCRDSLYYSRISIKSDHNNYTDAFVDEWYENGQPLKSWERFLSNGSYMFRVKYFNEKGIMLKAEIYDKSDDFILVPGN